MLPQSISWQLLVDRVGSTLWIAKEKQSVSWGKDSFKGKKLVPMGAHCIYIEKKRQKCDYLSCVCVLIA